MGYADHRIALSILEHDVVVRRIFLDEIVLKQEGLVLVACDDMVDPVDLGYQGLGLGILVGKKVAVDPSMKVLCLSYIDDCEALVPHQVAAWVMWQLAGLLTSFGQLILFHLRGLCCIGT